MVVALGVMLVCSLLVAAALEAANGDIDLSHRDTLQKQAYYAALAGVRGGGGQARDEVPGSICAAESAGGAALLGRAEHQEAVRTEIGAEVDEMADVLPAPAAEIGIGRSDMQSLGANHEPVQADEL